MPRNPRADQIGTGGRIKSESPGGCARNAHWTATGVEIAQSSYQTQFIEVAGIETSFCGYQEFETSKSFDLVVDNGTFHHQHPDERASYLGKIADQMTANGKFLLTTYFTHKHDADCTEVLEDGRFRFSLNTKSLSDMFVKHCPRLFVEQETRIVRTERDQDCVLFVIRKHGAQK